MENGKLVRTENEKRKMENEERFFAFSLRSSVASRRRASAVLIFTFAFCLSPFALSANAQETPPAPGAPRPVTIPAVQEKRLPNGLTVVVVERKNVPLVTASLLVKSGANSEDEAQAGVADMTAALLTKGTKTRTATQIAEQIESLGGSLNTGANWLASNVTLNITSDKLSSAMSIMADACLNPTFKQSEIDLLKTQTLDDLNVQLKQPSALAAFAASRYTYGEHSAIGTPKTIAGIERADISNFYRQAYMPYRSVLVFAGDISGSQANALALKYFGVWKNLPGKEAPPATNGESKTGNSQKAENRILVIDLPNSGQAAVTYAKKLSTGRTFYNLTNNSYKVSDIYYPALVTNSVLGGGYTNRLNLEIRIKRGLSYGARSNLSWRDISSNFSAGAQTKNVSAAEVAELLATEIDRIGNDLVGADELTPRTATLVGNFSRSLETTNGLAAQISELYLYGINPKELNAYTQNLRGVSDAQVKDFAQKNIKGGDIIIVGDYAKFKDDLAKRFPNQTVEVIPASRLNLNSDTLK